MRRKQERIISIDVLRGLVMVIMALDHTRDYFHLGSFNYNPADPETTNPVLFFTRFITHYCAPIFIFLAGTAAFLFGQKRNKIELSKFLLTRGIWLVFVDVFVCNLIWWFNWQYDLINFQVLTGIGLSMIVLAGLLHLRLKVLLGLSLLIVFGHNLLDPIVVEGISFRSVSWYFLHQMAFLPISETRAVLISYPVIPWASVMCLGYCLGQLYVPGFKAEIRQKWLFRVGLGATLLFFVIRLLNVYGDPFPWEVQESFSQTIFAFFNVFKYPPSLAFLLITLGPGLLFLYAIEGFKNKCTEHLLVFGRVPFMFYLLHVLVIHVLAFLVLLLTGGDWTLMVMDLQSLLTDDLTNYGYPLWVVYLVWIAVILICYPICRNYMHYKSVNRDKWWLSYL